MNINYLLVYTFFVSNLAIGGPNHDHSHSDSDRNKTKGANAEEGSNQKNHHEDDHSNHERHDDQHSQDHDEHPGHGNHSEHKSKNSVGHDEHKDPDDHESHGDHHDHGSQKFGKGKAIEEVKKEGRIFKLADTAIKTLQIETINLGGPVQEFFEVPSACVVEFQKETGIYRINGSWFELVEVVVGKRSDKTIQIKSDKLVTGDEIVNGGVALVHVAQLEASGQGGEGHVH